MDKAQDAHLIEFQTAMGRFVFYPNWGVLEDYLLTPVKQAVAEAEEMDRLDRAHYLIQNFMDQLVQLNLQEAIIQAADELIALAKATVAESQQERNNLAKDVANEAYQASLARLRHTHYFPKVNPKRGEKRQLSVKEVFSELYDKYFTRERKIRRAIRHLLEVNNGDGPTMGAVAKLLNMGTPKTERGHDSGERMLARELKAINPGQEARAVFNRLISEAKTELWGEI